jgi:hypothetical protein
VGRRSRKEELAKRLHEYVEAYYSSFNKEVAQYSQIADAFPAAFVGPKSGEAIAAVGGIVLVHRAATEFSFAYHERQLLLDDVISDLTASPTVSQDGELPQRFTVRWTGPGHLDNELWGTEEGSDTRLNSA